MASAGLRIIVGIVLIVMGMGLVLLPPTYYVETLSGFGFVYPTDPTSRLITYFIGGILIIAGLYIIMRTVNKQ